MLSLWTFWLVLWNQINFLIVLTAPVKICFCSGYSGGFFITCWVYRITLWFTFHIFSLNFLTFPFLSDFILLLILISWSRFLSSDFVSNLGICFSVSSKLISTLCICFSVFILNKFVVMKRSCSWSWFFSWTWCFSWSWIQLFYFIFDILLLDFLAVSAGSPSRSVSPGCLGDVPRPENLKSLTASSINLPSWFTICLLSVSKYYPLLWNNLILVHHLLFLIPFYQHSPVSFVFACLLYDNSFSFFIIYRSTP